IKKALLVSEYLHFFSFTSIFAAGILGNFSWFYWIGAAIFAFFLIYQHTLVKPKELSNVNRAFFTSNGMASVVFSVFVLIDILYKNYF
ncbi:MAG: 4-hydroxybenzoate octaprenyltransferase, partial [Bacteroidota bacterium]|nr:4-hydroxybenzoate octaprenyltransferase [Bacteroidota bacterium]